MYRVLFADDESNIRRGIKCLLDWESMGFSTDYEAENGQEALDEMAKQACPIVIMDVKMPVMDGLTALQHILKRWPGTQIILLSGHADMQIAVQAMDEGAFGYLMKPVDFDDLLFKIEDADTQMRLEARS
jgi:YesN/AraC family two-component response regulator